MDAITLLKADHKTVEQLFKRFEKAGENARAEKRKIVDRIIEELAVHAAIECEHRFELAGLGRQQADIVGRDVRRACDHHVGTAAESAG